MFSSQKSLRYQYRIEHISTEDCKVTILCSGTRTIIKTSFEGAIFHNGIIDGLSPYQASLLGGFYGRALRSGIGKKEISRRFKRMSFLLKEKNGRYKVLYQNRDGTIGYVDKTTRQVFVELPITVAQSESIINGFHPTQACYIGILAGIQMEKALSTDDKTGQNTTKKILNAKPKLRLVE